MSQLKTVKLYGALTKFSDEALPIKANDNRDTFSMLKSWFPSFKRFMHENPNFYIVLSDKDKANPRPISSEFVMSPYGECEEIHIFPANDVAGVEVAAYFALSGFMASAVAFAVNIVISMALSAIVQALSPKPEANGQEKVDEAPSFLYNGPENVTEQGYQVPIVYGTHMTGSVVLSAGVSIEQTGSVNPGGAQNPNSNITPRASFQWSGKGGFRGVLTEAAEYTIESYA